MLGMFVTVTDEGKPIVEVAFVTVPPDTFTSGIDDVAKQYVGGTPGGGLDSVTIPQRLRPTVTSIPVFGCSDGIIPLKRRVLFEKDSDRVMPVLLKLRRYFE